jgi:FkbM family methyltransferase
MDRKLIFDIGLHNGLDTKFYADKGFKVVSLEANPAMCVVAGKVLASELKSGQVTFVQKALWETAGQTITFYTNADKDDWGSAFRGIAEKGMYTAQEITVPTLTLADLFNAYGVPYYIKCDIEGGDAIFVRQLLKDARRPAHVSIEAMTLTDVVTLAACGYDRFQIINQQFTAYTKPPQPAREGRYVDVTFNGHMSGLFGRELDPARWVSIDDVCERFSMWTKLRLADSNLAPGWLDFHATTAAELAAAV